MDLRIKQLTRGGSKDSPDDSRYENQSDSDILQQIRQELSSKVQSGKPLNTTLAFIISEIWEKPPPKDILLKKLDIYEIRSNSKVLQVKKVIEVWSQRITPKIRQKDLKNQHNQSCITKSAVAISNLADELIKCNKDKNLLGKEYRQTCRSLQKLPQVPLHCWHKPIVNYTPTRVCIGK